MALPSLYYPWPFRIGSHRVYEDGIAVSQQNPALANLRSNGGCFGRIARFCRTSRLVRVLPTVFARMVGVN